MTRTETLGSTVRRFASTSPAVPPPTIMKSKASSPMEDKTEVMDGVDGEVDAGRGRLEYENFTIFSITPRFKVQGR